MMKWLGTRQTKGATMTQKGRTPPLPHIDHASALRDRLGAVVAQEFNPGVKWETYAEVQREQYRAIGQAVMDAIVVQGTRSGEFSVSSIYGYARRNRMSMSKSVYRRCSAARPKRAKWR